MTINCLQYMNEYNANVIADKLEQIIENHRLHDEDFDEQLKVFIAELREVKQ